MLPFVVPLSCQHTAKFLSINLQSLTREDLKSSLIAFNYCLIFSSCFKSHSLESSIKKPSRIEEGK